MPDSTAYAKGVMGEVAAKNWLVARGMRPLQENYRVPGGEIDLILSDGATLVFVEVKSRKNPDLVSAQASISPKKKQCILIAARRFLGEHPEWMNHEIRFDAVFLLRGQIVHVPDAFSGLEWE